MSNKDYDIIEEYNKYFVTYVTQYTTPERQAEQFKIVSALKNTPTTETINSITETRALQNEKIYSDV